MRYQRWIFIIEGSLTIVVGFLGYILLPNYPHNTPFLTETETALAQYRLAVERDGDNDEVQESVFIGLKQAVVDPKTWLLVLILTGAVVSMSFTCKSSSPGRACMPLLTINSSRQKTFFHPLWKLLGTEKSKPFS